MSTIYRFARLKIRLFINENDHAPPHLHMDCPLTVFRLRLADGTVMDRSSLRYVQAAQKELRIVRQWMEGHRTELLERWQQHENGQKVEPIY